MADSSQKKTRRSPITHKAWSLVRMALLWGRKGGVLFKRWPLFELRSLFSKHLKALAHMRHHSSSNGDRYYGERQLSFDETPLFNIKRKMHRPTTSSMRFLLLPCIAPPPVDFDYVFEMDGQDYSDDVQPYGYDELKYESCTEEDDKKEEKGVDVRAEEFIAKFYEQIKLQRQVSYLEYKQHNDAV